MSNSQINEPEGKSYTTDELKGSLGHAFFKVSEMTTGLGVDKVEPNGPEVQEVIAEIGKLDIGNLKQIPNIWDCTERAIWCIAHIRRMFPGFAIGMVEGIASVGTIVNEAHAVLVLWDKNFEPTLCDPQQIGKTVTFSKIVRITAFPFASDDQDDTVEPIKAAHLPRLKDGQLVHFDSLYWIYPTKTILDYLKKAIYEDECPSYFSHLTIHGDRDKWKAADAAFWAYAHMRRKFPGCAIGVALGKPKSAKDPVVVNLIFTKKGDIIEPIYWRPARLPKNRKPIEFDPTRIFM